MHSKLQLFKSTTAFFTPLLPPSLKSLFCSAGGHLVSYAEIEERGSGMIDYFFGIKSGKSCPLIERLRAVGVEVIDYKYIQDSIDSGILLNESSYLFETVKLLSKSSLSSPTSTLTNRRKSSPEIILKEIPTYTRSKLSIVSNYHEQIHSPPALDSPAASPEFDSNYFIPRTFPEILNSDVRNNSEEENEELSSSISISSSSSNSKFEVEMNLRRSDPVSSTSISKDQVGDDSGFFSDSNSTISASPNTITKRRKRVILAEEDEVEDDDDDLEERSISTVKRTKLNSESESPAVEVKKEDVEESQTLLTSSTSSSHLSSEVPLSPTSIFYTLSTNSNPNSSPTIPISSFLNSVENLLDSKKVNKMSEVERSSFLRSGLNGFKNGEGGFVAKRIEKG